MPGVLLGIFLGTLLGAPPGSPNPDPISDKKCHFPYSFSEQTSKIYPLFQTWPLDRNCVIITWIRAQTKEFFKRISNSHISIPLLFIWNWKDNYVHTLRNSIPPKPYIADIQTKMGKVYTRFQTKKAQRNPTGTYLDSLYKGVPPGFGYKEQEQPLEQIESHENRQLNTTVQVFSCFTQRGNFIYPMMHLFILYYQASERTWSYQFNRDVTVSVRSDFSRSWWSNLFFYVLSYL